MLDLGEGAEDEARGIRACRAWYRVCTLFPHSRDPHQKTQTIRRPKQTGHMIQTPLERHFAFYKENRVQGVKDGGRDQVKKEEA